MNAKDFETTKAIFEVAKKALRNDEKLGDFLVDIGVKLAVLGVQENMAVSRRSL